MPNLVGPFYFNKMSPVFKKYHSLQFVLLYLVRKSSVNYPSTNLFIHYTSDMIYQQIILFNKEGFSVWIGFLGLGVEGELRVMGAKIM